ncbi:hypothetical protein [Halomicronema sp. CCY15110]|uniref:hypothetical protein n=1 Tax=Halomicronema sp. CCY15110 TaxID=2767773 RepID=UPI00194E99D7|nr:hypothetical protein [Halomicronema sp. CCY15110]
MDWGFWDARSLKIPSPTLTPPTRDDVTGKAFGRSDRGVAQTDNQPAPVVSPQLPMTSWQRFTP